MQNSVTASRPCVNTAEVFKSDQVNFDSTCAAGEFESPEDALGPLGNMFLSDMRSGKFLKVRVSHYPANIKVEVR